MATVSEVLGKLKKMDEEMARIIEKYDKITDGYQRADAILQHISDFRKLKLEIIDMLPEVFGMTFHDLYNGLSLIDRYLDNSAQELSKPPKPEETKRRLEIAEVFLKAAKAEKGRIGEAVKEEKSGLSGRSMPRS